MSGASIATAYVSLVPSFDGVQAAINTEFSGVGRRIGNDMARDLRRADFGGAGRDAGDQFTRDFNGRLRSGRSDAEREGARTGESFGQGASSAASQGGDSAGGSFLSGLKGKAMLGVAGVAAAAGALFMDAFNEAMDVKKAGAKAQATLGISPAEAQALGKQAGELYAKGYGESIPTMVDALATVKGSIKGLNGADLQGVTGKALSFSDAFGVDIADSVQSVNTLISSGLAKDATGAFDLLTAASQKVPEALRGDITAASDEYGQFFNTLGFSGDEAFGALVAGADKGAYGIDKTGDAIKEFTLLSTDGSKATAEAYESIGLNAGEMSNAILGGGDGAKAAFDKIITGVQGIKDPTEQANAALAFFGTPLEDMNKADIPQFLEGLGGMTGGLGDVAGASEKMDSAMGSTTTGFELFQRGLKSGVTDFMTEKVMPVLSKFGDWLGEVLPPIIKKVGEWFEQKVVPVLEKVGDLFTNVLLPAAMEAAEWFEQNMLPTIERVFGFIGSTIENIVTIIGGVIDFVVGVFTGDWQRAWDGISAIFGGIWDQIKNVFNLVWETIKDVFTNIGPSIMGILEGLGGKLLEWGGQLITWIWDGITAAAPAIWDWFKNLPDAIWGTIQDVWAKVGEWGTSFMNWIWTGSADGTGEGGIKGGAAALLQYFMDLPANFWSGLQNIWSKVSEWGTSFMNFIWTGSADGTGTGGVNGVAYAFKQWLMDLPSNIWTGIKDVWAKVGEWGTSLMNWIWTGSADGSGEGGVKGGATSLLNWFAGLPEMIWQKIIEFKDKIIDIGKSVIGWIVDGIKAVAGAVWDAISGALTGEATMNEDGGVDVNDLGVTLGGSARGGTIHNTGGGDSGFAAGGVVPGTDPGRRDNVLARLPNGAAWGLRSEESVFVPEFTRAIGGAPTVNAWNRLAEQGRLGDIGVGMSGGFATGGVVGARKAAEERAQKLGADTAWARAKELIEENKRGVGSGGTFDGAIPSAPGTRGEFIKAVASKMGLPYVWGGASPDSFDCSGLMSWALGAAGAGIGRLTAAAFGDRFPRVSPEKPGDMAIFDTGRVSPKAGHIGMVLDPAAGTMMHTDGAGPSRVSDYRNRGGLMGFIDPIGGEYSPMATPAGSAKPTAGAWLAGVLGKARAKLGVALNNAVGASVEPGGSGVERWRSTVLQALQMTGHAASEADIVLNQIRTESSGDPNAINLTDSNARAGHPSRGLVQTIPTTFAAYAEPGYNSNIVDPLSNIMAGINYATSRYGSLAKGMRGVAYDQGGMLEPGTIGMNFLNKPEAVLTPDMTAAYKLHAKDLASGGGRQLVINLDNSDPLQVAVASMIRMGVDDGFDQFAKTLTLTGAQAL